MSPIDYIADECQKYAEDSTAFEAHCCKFSRITMDTKRAIQARSHSITLRPKSPILFQIEARADVPRRD